MHVEPLHGNDVGVVLLTATVTAVVAARMNDGLRTVADALFDGRVIEKLTGAKPAGPAVGFAFAEETTALAGGVLAVPPPPPQAVANTRQLAPRSRLAWITITPCSFQRRRGDSCYALRAGLSRGNGRIDRAHIRAVRRRRIGCRRDERTQRVIEDAVSARICLDVEDGRIRVPACIHHRG